MQGTRVINVESVQVVACFEPQRTQTYPSNFLGMTRDV